MTTSKHAPQRRTARDYRNQFARLARTTGRRASNALAVFRQPLYAPPGHFLSPLSSDADIERGLHPVEGLPGLDLHLPSQRALVSRLRASWSSVPTGPDPSWRYQPENNMYGLPDAAIYYGMLDALRPSRILEVGSGYSTALALDHADRHEDVHVTCIEPYPERLRSLLLPRDNDRVRVLEQMVQDTPMSTFAELGRNDILFIDSSHVAKVGSDVNWLYFNVLPTLAPGVIVQIHDVFWPFEYPESWLRERRDWTEAYLLRALLTDSPSWRVMLFSHLMWTEDPGAFPPGPAPGSIWLERVSA